MNRIRRLVRRLLPGRARAAQEEHGLYRRVRNLELALNAILDGLDYRPDEAKGFNGQAGRKRIFDELLAHCGFKALVETGTWVGDTAGYMHERAKLPVYSCEVEERFHRIAARRLRDFEGIRLYLGSSATMLAALAESPVRQAPTFFYLDAHWYDDVPVVGELEVIAAHWKDYVAMIDDFEVPGDKGYGCDTDRKGRTLCLDLIRDCVARHRMAAFYPALASTDETGKKRGCVVLASPGDMADRVRERVTALQAVP